MSIPIQFRRGTVAEWAAADPVLLQGELGLLLTDSPDTQNMKIGNGTSKWSELPWALRGPRGFDFSYEWDGTRLGVKHSDEADFTYIELKGDKGDQGFSLLFTWDGTRLGIKREGEASFSFVDLKGEKGDKGDTGDTGLSGEKGDKPAHEWSGTSIRFENPDGSFGSLVDLKGDTGTKGDKGETGNPGLLSEGKMWVGNASGVAEETVAPPLILSGSADSPDPTGLPEKTIYFKHE